MILKQMKKIFYSLVIIVISISNLNAQLKIVPLEYNPEIEKNKKSVTNIVEQRSSNDTLNLPFIEDFAHFDIYPDNSLWLDSQVYINNSYPDTPIFRGVATFDCLNKDGLMHSNANTFTFIADTLTSKPIKLAYQKSDSVYFSFFYQPQGFAYDPPEFQDSLVLQFRSPLHTQWKSVWSKNGEPNYPFEQAMISITDSVFLVDGFQFRFKNYASVSSDNRSSNGDYWNLDLIRLDTGRTQADTLIADVGFVYAPGSFIKDYYSMPWLHWSTTMDRKQNTASYRNYGPTTIGIDRNLYSNPNIYSPAVALGTIDIYGQDFHELNIQYTTTLFDPGYFPQDSAKFIIKTVVFGNAIVGNGYNWNDTAYFSQEFNNYYAYDDGNPEAGIGIDGENSSGSEIMIKYYSLQPDTLRSVRFWFNRTHNQGNKDLAFDLVIRQNNEGMPGDIIYEEIELLSRYSYGLDNYVDYVLENPILLQDTFFVGFRQNHENYFNLGFDKNTDASEKTFYFIEGFWSQSYHKGSIMIRPVFGDKFDVSVNNISNIDNKFTLYPNPAKNTININTDIKDYSIEIFNQTGVIIKSAKNIKSIDISNLNNGIYLFRISTDNGFSTKKIIVNH